LRLTLGSNTLVCFVIHRARIDRADKRERSAVRTPLR
jgi:hypothetical protein